MSLSKDDLDDMNDDELELAFKAAKAEIDSGQNSFGTSDDDDGTVLGDDTNTDDDSSAGDDDGDDEIFGDQTDTDTDDDTDTADDDEGGDGKSTTDAVADEGKTKPAEAVEGEIKHTFKANNKEYEFTKDEIMQQFPRVFGQAMDYTKKLQTIQPWRRTIDALEQAKINHQDVNLMIDVLKGDKEAIAEVLKRTGVDTLDINTDQPKYTEKEYGRSDGELAIADVLDGIKHDPEYAVTHRVLTRDWDEASWNKLASDPVKIRQLHVDVKSGMFDKLQPVAEKYRVYDQGRKTDLDYYLMAAKDHYAKEERAKTQARSLELAERETTSQTQVASAKQQQQKRDAVKQDASRRKAAAPSGRASARGTVTDYLTASDEDFDDWYKRLSDRE